MAGRVPKRTTNPGKGPTAGQGKTGTVGYGLKGNAFHNQQNFDKSKAKAMQNSGAIKGRGVHHAAFLNQAKYNASAAGRLHNANPSGGSNPVHQQPHAPMPGHPSQNPTSYHGPATLGKIAGPAPRR